MRSARKGRLYAKPITADGLWRRHPSHPGKRELARPDGALSDDASGPRSLQTLPDQTKHPSGRVGAGQPAFLTVFPSIMLPMFLAVVDQTIVATALPAIAAATGEVQRASWIVVAYLVASTIAAPIYGR